MILSHFEIGACLQAAMAPRLPFALLPTVLSDVRHMGLLLAGARGVLEERDRRQGIAGSQSDPIR